MADALVFTLGRNLSRIFFEHLHVGSTVKGLRVCNNRKGLAAERYCFESLLHRLEALPY